ncbi:MAG: AbrB/MazE/SpoVT family DNA-binding domain-containing protein [Deltaproteobacteria bacterium]|nr:AbrB/MazE/SpoVT family DNA-binding domain-containing protein [Deltaproteobacteria bacterium]
MVKTLSAIGNSLGIIIDKPILDLLKIERDTPLEITTDGDTLTIRPQRQTPEQRLMAAAEQIMDEQDETFRRLAE